MKDFAEGFKTLNKKEIFKVIEEAWDSDQSSIANMLYGIFDGVDYHKEINDTIKTKNLKETNYEFCNNINQLYLSIDRQLLAYNKSIYVNSRR